MALGFNHIIAPQPVAVSVQTCAVANILAIMGGLPLGGGDERHIGINEWVDRVRLSLPDDRLHDVALVMWGLGIEGLLNAVEHPQAINDFDVFLRELRRLPANILRDACLYWLVNSAHRRVFLESQAFTPIAMADLLGSRERFARYLEDHTSKELLKHDIEPVVDLYLDPRRLKQLTITVLTDLWENHFQAEWTRHQAEIKQVVEAFTQVDTSGLTVFEAIQTITGRDLRPVFNGEVLSQFEQIICVPSKHNGPYVIWFGDDKKLYLVFTARMPSTVMRTGQHQPDLNVLIQRFKALSDENRMQVLLAIREQHELSTQDIIDQFDLNKSAASRYLGQLFANGFITERRDTDGKTKYYSVDDEAIDQFLGAIATLLKP